MINSELCILIHVLNSYSVGQALWGRGCWKTAILTKPLSIFSILFDTCCLLVTASVSDRLTLVPQKTTFVNAWHAQDSHRLAYARWDPLYLDPPKRREQWWSYQSIDTRVFQAMVQNSIYQPWWQVLQCRWKTSSHINSDLWWGHLGQLYIYIHIYIYIYKNATAWRNK